MAINQGGFYILRYPLPPLRPPPVLKQPSALRLERATLP